MPRAAGLDVVALTDHDTVRGHGEAVSALPAGLTLVTGAELSCRLGGIGVHMLAYLFDAEEPEFARERELVRDDRVPRARAMVGKLQDLGVGVTWEQVARIAYDGSVGRPHIATALVELGVVPTVSDAFTPDWLADGGRAYAEKHELDPFEAVRLVKAAGGVTVLAHPAAVKRGQCVSESAIAELASGRPGRHRGGPHGPRRRHPHAAARPGRGPRPADHRVQRLPRQPQDLLLGEYTTDPEIYGEITRRATGAFPVPGAGGRER